MALYRLGSQLLRIGGGVGANAVTPGALRFVPTGSAENFDYGVLATLPDGFGDGEFAFEIWVRPTQSGQTVNSLTIDTGSTASVKEARWSSDSSTIYGAADWWFLGNFLLDGHNNNAVYDGTCSIQLTATGRAQWTFGDGAAANARTGDVHGMRGTTNLLDGAWHSIICVRRWDGGTGSELELWVDGVMEDSETSTARTDMAATYWDSWTGYPTNQQNWMFGAEKQAALNLGDWEDYMGLVDKISFYNRAPTTGELAAENITSGLVGRYNCSEGTGTTVGDSEGGASISLVNPHASVWVTDDGV